MEVLRKKLLFSALSEAGWQTAGFCLKKIFSRMDIAVLTAAGQAMQMKNISVYLETPGNRL
ncbi:MAG: hypothetical protein Q4G07_09300 [Oscillospiraceae bacterium]|nr:hypothetical protein [Oscillospiraceae bacterium]